MSVIEFGHFVLTIAILLVAVHGLGYLAERLKQPRIVGEILAGILLGPFVLRLLAPTAFAKLFLFSPSAGTVMGFLYQLGLILLMFCSGPRPAACWRRRIGAMPSCCSRFPISPVSPWSSVWVSRA
jgi:hypothetical protein